MVAETAQDDEARGEAGPPIVLRDAASGSTAAILPGLGFNCSSFRPVVGGEAIETLWAAPGFGTAGSRPTRSGIPLLFPFAGRLSGETFAFGGREYRVKSAGRSGGYPIHGLVFGRPWRVVEQAAEWATGVFQAAVDAPELLAEWPADFRIAVTYEVAGPELRCGVRIDNPDAEGRPLPFGFGAHPYFRLPLGGPAPDECRVTVPAAEYWELAEMLPTGRRLPVSIANDLRAGPRFGDLTLDDVLTGLPAGGGSVRTTIVDPGSGRVLTQTFDAACRHCVVFTPPHREAIAIEPYTAVPDAFALAARGIETGLRVLAPDESVDLRILIRLDGGKFARRRSEFAEE